MSADSEVPNLSVESTVKIPSSNKISIGNGQVNASSDFFCGDDGNDLAAALIGFGSTIANAGSCFEANDGEAYIKFNGTIRHTFENNKVSFTNGGLGVGTSGSTTVGLIRATNDIVAFYSSDKRLKENIKRIPNALKKLAKLNGVEFDWKPTTEEEKRFVHANEGHDIGVIAQEIEKVLPETVETRKKSGYKAVKYEKIVPLLIEAIKELKQEVDELKKQIK